MIDTKEQLEIVIDQLIERNEKVNFSTIAKAIGMSITWTRKKFGDADSIKTINWHRGNKSPLAEILAKSLNKLAAAGLPITYPNIAATEGLSSQRVHAKYRALAQFIKSLQHQERLDQAMQMAQQYDCHLVSVEWENTFKPMKWQCSNPEHSPFLASFSQLKYTGFSTSFCPRCRKHGNMGNTKHDSKKNNTGEQHESQR